MTIYWRSERTVTRMTTIRSDQTIGAARGNLGVTTVYPSFVGVHASATIGLCSVCAALDMQRTAMKTTAH